MYKQNKCANKINVQTKYMYKQEYMYKQSKCTGKINVQTEYMYQQNKCKYKIYVQIK